MPNQSLHLNPAVHSRVLVWHSFGRVSELCVRRLSYGPFERDGRSTPRFIIEVFWVGVEPFFERISV